MTPDETEIEELYTAICDALYKMGKLGMLLARAGEYEGPDPATDGRYMWRPEQDQPRRTTVDGLREFLGEAVSSVKPFAVWANEAPRSSEEIGEYRWLADYADDLRHAIRDAQENGDLEGARLAFNSKRDEKELAQ